MAYSTFHGSVLGLLIGMAGIAAAAQPAKSAATGQSEPDLAVLFERITAARQRLTQRETGPTTQADQKAALALFDRLITAAQRDEEQQRRGAGRGGGSGGGKKEEPPKPEAKDQENSEDKSAGSESSGTTTSGTRSGAGGEWGRLRDRDREPVLNALRERFPPRYRQLVEQYFQSFQHDRR